MGLSISFADQLTYAAKELAYFLNAFMETDSIDRTVSLSTDSSLPIHHYCIHGDGCTLIIRGGSPSSVLCGVYDALSEAGVFFEATGWSVPFAFCPDVFFSLNKDVQPKFRLRGVRQHINFPMDISSYTLEEAKEYIRSIARMRFNAITFHSYPGQWHEVNANGDRDYAGHFFYGKTYPVPKEDPLTAGRVHNKEIYCIPEAEPIYYNETERSKFAINWLNELMKTAKEAYMNLTLSVEVTFDGDDRIESMLSTICRNYPLIDTLELISEECGGFREMPELTMENIKDYMAGIFDDRIFDENGALPGLPDFVPHQLGATAISVRRVLRALELRENWLGGLDRKPQLRAGIYATCPDTLRVLRPILRDRLPDNITMSLLPAHGSAAVADNVAETGTIKTDWQNTMFYSWAEFDGNMFLQQLSTDGIEQLVGMPSEESYGFCINHWRTAENSLTISYTSEAAISGMKAAEYYADYAKRIGITDIALFVKTCTDLAALDTFNRDNLFNIGFCAVTCWYNWCRKGEAITPRGFPANFQTQSIERYERITADFKMLLPTAERSKGKDFIELMINRCQTSILHIRALMALDRLFDLYDYDHPHQTDEERLTKIKAALSESRRLAMDYLHLYGEILPDRGGEGHLVSYYETTVAFIDAVAANFTGKGNSVIDDEYDAPPMPDAQVI